MSSRELNRVAVRGRVGSGDLKLNDAAVMLELSYRQTKRLWRRYRQVGSQGLKHSNAGRPSNRSKPLKLRRRVLHLIRKKYSGSEEERFGPTLAAEHLAEEDGIVLDHETYDFGCCKKGCGAGSGNARNTASQGSANRTSGNWCSWTAVSMLG
jgi:hypothetical protein